MTDCDGEFVHDSDEELLLLHCDGNRGSEEAPADENLEPKSSNQIKGAKSTPSASFLNYKKADKTAEIPDDHREEFSGMRVTNRLLSSGDMTSICEGRTFYRLSRLVSTPRSALEDADIDWLTVGCVVEKSAPKTSSKGSSFAVWGINDLGGCAVSVFLFGEAYTSHHALPVGTLIVLFNSAIMASSDKGSQAGSFSLKVASPNQIVKLGVSMDYAQCKGSRKSDGSRCTMPVNKAHGSYCQFHAAAHFKQLLSSRPAINAPGLARIAHVPNLTKNLSLGKFKHEESTIQISGRAGMSSGGPSKLIRQQELEGIHNRMAGQASRGARMLASMKAGPAASLAVMNIPESAMKFRPDLVEKFGKHGTTSRVKTVISQAATRPALSLGRPGPGARESAGDILGNFLSQQSSDPLASTRPLKRARVDTATVPGTGQTRKVPGPTPRLQVNSAEWRKRETELKREILGSRGSGLAARGRVAGGLAKLSDAAICAALSRKSRHADAGEAEKAAAVKKQVDYLATKDEFLSSLEDIREITVTAVCCAECGYLAEEIKALCKGYGHEVTRTKVKKQFFTCRRCELRLHTLGDSSLGICPRCGHASWRQSGMLERRLGKMAAEEHKDHTVSGMKSVDD